MVLYGTFTNVTFTDATFSDVTFTDVNNPTEAHFTDPFFVLAPNGNQVCIIVLKKTRVAS